MDTNNLLRSTLTEDCRTQKNDQRTCLLCGLSYFWRPSRCRAHLGLEESTKHVQVCKPYPEHCDRFSEVVRELRERDTQTKQAAREVTKRSLESGAPDDAINVENFCTTARVSDARPFKIVRTRDEVDMQWARAAVSAGLPMSFFDNKEVRKAVRMTAECGENYIRTKPGGVKETTLPHRTYFTTKLIPKLDKFIDGKNMGKMREMAEELAAAVFSDGWTAVNHHPIVNIIMGVRSLHTLRASIDTMGEEKTMDFIAALIVQHIKEIGEGRVFVVCMDGACKGAFVLIQKEFPWVQCFVCPAHAIDGFLKNVGSSTESIRMQANVMGDVPASEMDWNESFFRDCFDNVSKMVTWISRKQKPFARFQTIAQELIKERKIKCGAAMFKSVETRFASQVSMTERALQQKKVFKTLAKDELFLEWLGKQPKVIRLEVQALVCMTLLFSYFQSSYFVIIYIVSMQLFSNNMYYFIYYMIYV